MYDENNSAQGYQREVGKDVVATNVASQGIEQITGKPGANVLNTKDSTSEKLDEFFKKGVSGNGVTTTDSQHR